MSLMRHQLPHRTRRASSTHVVTTNATTFRVTSIDMSVTPSTTSHGNAVPPFRLSTMQCFMLFQAQTGERLCSPTPSIMGVPKRRKSSPFSLVSVSQTSCSPGKGVFQVTIPIQGQEAYSSQPEHPPSLRWSCQLVSVANREGFERSYQKRSPKMGVINSSTIPERVLVNILDHNIGYACLL